MIPKIIHFCWFGGNPLPPLAQKCIASWKKYLPDYEIKEWNESNFDVNSIAYTAEAYSEKKYAFVSDYARFEILYNYGGVYFDTDVEVIASMDDIIEKGAFMGCEQQYIATRNYKSGHDLSVAPGLGLGVNPGLGLYKELLDLYATLHFKNADGSLNTKTIVAYTTELLCKNGLIYTDAIQYVAGIYIYPKDYFCPLDYNTAALNITANTRSIHHYTASWQNEMRQNAKKIEYKLLFIPRSIRGYVAVLLSTIRLYGIKGLIDLVKKRI